MSDWEARKELKAPVRSLRIEEYAMSESKKKLTLGGVVKGLLWFLCAAGALLFIGLWILSSIGGNSEPLKEGLEQFLSDATGARAEIGKLNSVTIFPLAEINIENLVIKEREEARPVITAGKAKVSMLFWDILFSRKYIVDAHIENLELAGEVTGAAPLSLDRIKIEKEETDGSEPAMTLSGQYNALPLNARIDLESTSSGAYGNKYRVGTGGDVRFSLGDIYLQGTDERPSGRKGGHRITNLSAGVGEEELVSGTLDFFPGVDQAYIGGNLKSGDLVVMPDLRFKFADKTTQIRGDIVFEALSLDDFGGESGMLRFIAALSDALFPEGDKESETIAGAFAGVDAEAQIDVSSFLVEGKNIGNIKTSLRIKDKRLTLEPVAGTISDGKLSGFIRMGPHGEEQVMRLDGSIDLADFDLGKFQQLTAGVEAVSGQANIKNAFSAGFDRWDELAPNLSGEFALIAREGRLASGILDFWGGGVINKMLPDFGAEDRLVMNCAIADFIIENGVAESQALFLDAERIIVQGGGTIDLVNERIDLKLSPESKGIEIGTLTSVPVVISGPLSNASVSASTLGIGKKLGGLLLGTINPAFLAFSLTDLGLTEDHPCYAYIGDSKEELNRRVDPAEIGAEKETEDDEPEAQNSPANEKDQAENTGAPDASNKTEQDEKLSEAQENAGPEPSDSAGAGETESLVPDSRIAGEGIEGGDEKENDPAADQGEQAGEGIDAAP